MIGTGLSLNTLITAIPQVRCRSHSRWALVATFASRFWTSQADSKVSLEKTASSALPQGQTVLLVGNWYNLAKIRQTGLNLGGFHSRRMPAIHVDCGWAFLYHLLPLHHAWKQKDALFTAPYHASCPPFISFTTGTVKTMDFQTSAVLVPSPPDWCLYLLTGESHI